MALVLASKSPRRRELMALITPDFETDEAAIDEHGFSADTPQQLAQGLALQKALAVQAKRPQDVLIACDTVVDLDGCVLGKPKNEDDAIRMIRSLAGRAHRVHTGVAVLLPDQKQPATHFCASSKVCFAPIPLEAIKAYARTDESYDKAGGYGIQGWAAKYITGIQGCYYNVMGLPVAALYAELVRLGLCTES